MNTCPTTVRHPVPTVSKLCLLPPCNGPRPAFACARADQVALELRQPSEHSEHQPPMRRRGVGPCVTKRAETGLAARNRCPRVQQVAGGSRQPVEPRHHQHVTRLEGGNRLVKLRPVGFGKQRPVWALWKPNSSACSTSRKVRVIKPWCLARLAMPRAPGLRVGLDAGLGGCGPGGRRTSRYPQRKVQVLLIHRFKAKFP